jgi:phospholipid/cholesterol/gamma-HCH transport system substrate-binding protein
LVTTVAGHDQQLGGLIDQLDSLVGGVAGERSQLGTAITNVGTLTNNLSGVLTQSQPALNTDLAGLTTVSGTVAANQSKLDAFLQGLPGFVGTLDKVSSSGSFLNVYLCNLTLATSGPLQATLVPGDTATITVPTGTVGDSGNHTVNCQ